MQKQLLFIFLLSMTLQTYTMENQEIEIKSPIIEKILAKNTYEECLKKFASSYSIPTTWQTPENIKQKRNFLRKPEVKETIIKKLVTKFPNIEKPIIQEDITRISTNLDNVFNFGSDLIRFLSERD